MDLIPSWYLFKDWNLVEEAERIFPGGLPFNISYFHGLETVVVLALGSNVCRCLQNYEIKCVECYCLILSTPARPF